MSNDEKNTTPKISVITATYNGEKYISRTIESVLTQTLLDFEFIIIDDGSSDRTVEIINTYTKVDNRIKLIKRENPSGGPSIPKNTGLRMSKANYICFLDHDDYFHHQKLELMCKGLDQNKEWVAAFHDLKLVDAQENPHNGTYLSNANFLNLAASYIKNYSDDWYSCSEKFYEFMSLQYAAMHTISVVLAVDRLTKDPVSFRSRFSGSDDTDLWLRVGAQGTIGYLDTTLSFYRQHEKNLSLDTIKMTENAIEVHEENFLMARHRLSKINLINYKYKISNYNFELGYKFYKENKFKKSKKYYLKSINWIFSTKTIIAIIKLHLKNILFKVRLTKTMQLIKYTMTQYKDTKDPTHKK